MSVNQPDEMDEYEMSPEEERFERDLARAMRRVDVPQGFAERTLARAHSAKPADAGTRSKAKVFVMRPSVRAWISGAVAAALLTGVFVADQVRVRRQQEEVRAARQQFEAGLQITDAALDHARQQLANAGVQFGQ
jgi:hypothetical protein